MAEQGDAKPAAHPAHLYLHVPYCQSKCPYCDFNSIAGRWDEYAAYVDALLCELQRLPTGPYRTVFIGGGTPTVLPVAELARLLAGIRAHIRLSDDYEWTCEANPGSADATRFAVLAEHGVNRLSIGVQALQPQQLADLGRVHDAAEAEAALAVARRHVERVNADMIFGLPGQTPAQLRADLQLYRRHDLDHAAIYHLTIEPGTVYAAEHARGLRHEIDETISQALFATVQETLEGFGLAAYETSNFARPGSACRHNLAYWQLRDYQACGAGAVSTVAGRRCTREPHPGRYIAAMRAGQDAVSRTELLNRTERLREAWMLGLRLRTGVARETLLRLGDRPQRWQSEADRLIAQGVLEANDTGLRITQAGLAVQDHITTRLMP